MPANDIQTSMNIKLNTGMYKFDRTHKQIIHTHISVNGQASFVHGASRWL